MSFLVRDDVFHFFQGFMTMALLVFMTFKTCCEFTCEPRKKKPPTSHYTGWLIGILTMVYHNP